MILIRSSLVCVALLSALSTERCKPKDPTGDMTPPGFLQVIVTLEKPGDNPVVRGEFDITSQDVIRRNLSPDLKIRISAIAHDSESGIKRIELATISAPIDGNQRNLLFYCSYGRGSELEGLLTGILLPFALRPPPSPPPTTWPIDAVADPIAAIAAAGCARGPTGKGPVGIDGFIRLLVTNGRDMTAQSGTFHFEYADVGCRRC
jgi:hypothetical protein